MLQNLAGVELDRHVLGNEQGDTAVIEFKIVHEYGFHKFIKLVNIKVKLVDFPLSGDIFEHAMDILGDRCAI